MKITGDPSLKGADSTRGAQAKDKLKPSEGVVARDGGESQEEGKSDNVRLQLSPKEIQRIKNKLDALPDVDEARVQKIRKSLDDGSFRINYDRIADRLIEEARQVSSSVRKVVTEQQ